MNAINSRDMNDTLKGTPFQRQVLDTILKENKDVKDKVSLLTKAFSEKDVEKMLELYKLLDKMKDYSKSVMDILVLAYEVIKVNDDYSYDSEAPRLLVIKNLEVELRKHHIKIEDIDFEKVEEYIKNRTKN